MSFIRKHLYVYIYIYMNTHALLINLTLHLGHYMFLVDMLLPLPRKPSNSLRGHGIVVPRKNSAVGFFWLQRGWETNG